MLWQRSSWIYHFMADGTLMDKNTMASQKALAQKGADLAILFWATPVKYRPSLTVATLWTKHLPRALWN